VEVVGFLAVKLNWRECGEEEEAVVIVAVVLLIESQSHHRQDQWCSGEVQRTYQVHHS